MLLGDSAVGKSSLVLRFVKKQFFEYQESTIGAAFLTQTVHVDDAIVKFEIWDTAGTLSFCITDFQSLHFSFKCSSTLSTLANLPFLVLPLFVFMNLSPFLGQERYHSLAPMYYRGAAAAIVVYDITSMASFHRAKTWVKELQKQGNPNIIIALAGNKLDLEADRQVSREEAFAYAQEQGVELFETSAKTNVNVSEIFQQIARRLPKAVAPQSGKSSGIVVDAKITAPPKKACC